MDSNQNSRSTAEDDPVLMIHEKSRKLREKQARFIQKQNSRLIKSQQSCFLTDEDWSHIIAQVKPLNDSQVSALRSAIVHQGVPEQLRGKLWAKLLKCQESASGHSFNLYSKLTEFKNEEVENLLEKDVDRTMSELKLWREEIHCGNNKLFNVCKAYANYDNEVGYVQGLNYIVALMLIHI